MTFSRPMGERQGTVTDHRPELDQQGGDRWSAPVPAFSDPWIVGGFALGIGVAIDTLALHQPPGIGLASGLVLAVLAVAATGVLMELNRPRSVVWLTAAALILSGFVAVRSSPVLTTLNVGATLLLIAVISQLRTADDLARWTVADYVGHPLFLAADAARGSASFVRNDLRSGISPARRQRLRAVAFGLLIGGPIVAVFAGLFASADVSFDAYLQEVTGTWSLGSFLWRSALSLVVGLAVVGVWRIARRPPRDDDERIHAPATPGLDARSAMTVLALLVGLFGLFVVTQVLGHNPDLVTPQDYSRNARNGFFQLLAVACLVLALLLVFDWLIRRNSGERSRGFDRLAIALIGLTGIVMISALNRMRLYVNEFGFTELRIYTTVFMVWLGFVLTWFIVTVLRNRYARFAFGLLVSGLLVVGGLNVANPDALIVHFNWDRHLAGEDFAEEYTATLSTDAIPALVAIVDENPGEQFCFVERRVAHELDRLAAERRTHGLLSDSWSEFAARRALAGLSGTVGAGCE